MRIDLRSDTVTQPTAAMREAMFRAPLGDDVLREDPSVLALEARAADVLGKEAALFVPSGTMANQIALLLHCRPGDEVVCGRSAHVRLYESGAGAAWAGVQFAEVGDADGTFDVAALDAAVLPESDHAPRTRLVALENTHNRGGGSVWSPERLEAVCARARALGLALHLDGARLWNAAVALGLPEHALTAPFDTVSACFSKGLGAPVGSVIAGSREAMGRARRLRKMLGGGMRQAGILASAALHALEHHRARLADDHATARQLAEGLASLPALTIDPRAVRTNIVLFDLAAQFDITAFCARLAEEGVLVSPFGGRTIRAVTHLDVGTADIARAIDAATRVLRH